MASGIKIGQVTKELGISKSELKLWEQHLLWNVPRDSRKHRVFNGDWLKYIAKVKQRRDEGWAFDRIYYNIESPDRRQVVPTAQPVALGPEM